MGVEKTLSSDWQWNLAEQTDNLKTSRQLWSHWIMAVDTCPKRCTQNQEDCHGPLYFSVIMHVWVCCLCLHESTTRLSHLIW